MRRQGRAPTSSADRAATTQLESSVAELTETCTLLPLSGGGQVLWLHADGAATLRHGLAESGRLACLVVDREVIDIRWR